MFGALYAAEGHEALIEVAREFSPRIEAFASAQTGTVAVTHARACREVVLDLAGLTRLFGDTRTIAEELRRTAADRGLQIRVAIAGTRTAARLLVRHRAGLTVIAPGTDADAVSIVPLDVLASVHGSTVPNASNHPNGPTDPNSPHDLIRTLKRWGLRTLGAFAALPADDVAARLGQAGVRWQRVARGEDPRPLVPSTAEERFEQRLELDWPIEGLEPLSFVLGRVLDPLSAHLERRDRGAAVLHVRLRLVTRDVHERSLQLPVPMRDARTLRTLLLLDLESHPPPAAIDCVTVSVDPTPGRVVQFSLLARPLPSPEQLSTLMARLQALMGETRCGAPALVDSWEPGACVMKPFAPVDATPGDRGTEAVSRCDLSTIDAGASRALGASMAPCGDSASVVAVALRRFRFPVIARVRVEGGKPARVTTDRAGVAGGRVETCAGPWRTSGAWWLESTEAHHNRHAPKPGGGAGEGGLVAPKPRGRGLVPPKPRGGGPVAPKPRGRGLVPPKPRGGGPVSPKPEGEGGWPVSRSKRWDRDEWDVTLADGATYRIFRERSVDRWFLEGIVD